MEDSGNLSKKILNSIKAKLNELDAFTDDELPDYIMIMIANKKSKEAMTSSLELFLETNTQEFTDWLFALLEEMKEQQKKPAVEKEPVKKKAENKTKKEVEKIESEENDCFDDDVIDIMYEDEITPKEVKSKSSRAKESSSKTSSSRSSRNTENKVSKNKTKSKNVDHYETEPKRTKKRSLERKPSKSKVLDTKSKEIKQPEAKRSKVEVKAPKSKPSRIEYSPKADDRKNRREDRERYQPSSRREKSNRKIKVIEKESRKQRSRKTSTPPRAKRVKETPEEEKTDEVKRKKSQAVSSSVKMVKTKERFVSDDDEEQQSSKSMVSTVSVPVRKKPKLSKKQAPNPSLLLRAIRDATTSSLKNRKQKEAKVSVEATSTNKKVDSSDTEAPKYVQKVNFIRDRRRVQKRSDSDDEEDSKPAMPQRRIARRKQVSQENVQPKVEDKPKVETKFFVTLDKPFTRKKNQVEDSVSVFKTLGAKKKIVPIEAPDSTTTDIKPKVVKAAPEGPTDAVGSTKVTVKKEINKKEVLRRKQLQEKLQLERKLARVIQDTKMLMERTEKLHKQKANGVSSEDSRSIFINNVNFTATEPQLADFFSVCGKVTRTTIIKNHISGKPKGYAYLQFEDEQSVESAMSFNNTEFCSRKILVTRKKDAKIPQPKKIPPFATRPPAKRFPPPPAARNNIYKKVNVAPVVRNAVPVVKKVSSNKTWVRPGLKL